MAQAELQLASMAGVVQERGWRPAQANGGGDESQPPSCAHGKQLLHLVGLACAAPNGVAWPAHGLACTAAGQGGGGPRRARRAVRAAAGGGGGGPRRAGLAACAAAGGGGGDPRRARRAARAAAGGGGARWADPLR